MINKPLLIALIIIVILGVIAVVLLTRPKEGFTGTTTFHYFPVKDSSAASKLDTQLVDHYNYSCSNQGIGYLKVYLSTGDSVTASAISISDLSGFIELLSRKDIHYLTKAQRFANFYPPKQP